MPVKHGPVVLPVIFLSLFLSPASAQDAKKHPPLAVKRTVHRANLFPLMPSDSF